MKREGFGLFDVAMGSYDGAEVCQLVGMLALGQLSKWYNRCNKGFYRDDGLAITEISGSMAECASTDCRTTHLRS